MHPCNLLLERHLKDIQPDCWFLGFPAGAGPLWPDISYSLASSTDIRALNSVGESNRVQAGYDAPAEAVSQVIVYYPKSRQEAVFLIHLALSSLTPDGVVWVVGENKGGINSLRNMAKKHSWQLNKADSARHCSLFTIRTDEDIRSTAISGLFGFSDGPDQIRVASLPGVFGHGKIDRGTRLLLENLPPLSGSVLDLGCGSGLISAWVRKHNPETELHCADVHFYSLTATARTMEENGLGNIHCWHSDGFRAIDRRFNHIITNPPFHDGVHTQYDTTEHFIREARNHLEPHGTLTMVVNQFLKYEEQLQDNFGHYRELARGNGFKVLWTNQKFRP